MLDEIRIEDLGIIESAELRFGSGLTVISGETGAGKTMVLSGLGLLLGRKADPGTVRTGADQATVEGRLRIPPDGPVALRAVDAGGSLDDDELVVVRTVSSAGRSRAHVGGRSVPQAVLSEIADELVTVHGQSDQMRLRSTTHQRGALDEFAGADVRDLVEVYRQVYSRRSAATRELVDLVDSAAQRAQEADVLRFGLREIEAVDPQPGEDIALKEEAARLTNTEDLRTATTDAVVLLSGTDEPDGVDSAAGLLERARRALDHGAAFDTALVDSAARAGEIAYLVSDLATEIGAYVAGIEADPARLDEVNDRRAALGGLSRKYGASTDDVLSWYEDAAARLGSLDTDDSRIEELQAEVADLDRQVTDLATNLSALRTVAAGRLDEIVTRELSDLAMADSRFVTVLDPLDEPGPWGVDAIEFRLAAHAGATPRPLAKGASGGELSRVMLALEVALAGSRAGTSTDEPSARTFVFDEVDAGVGGRAAVDVGRRLKQLAATAQVIVVTHLAQVAAFADTHLVVRKSTSTADGDQPFTSADVHEVDGADRVQELARMLSGQDSRTALAHAEELLSLADPGS